MTNPKYDIFISYRRVGGAHYARILKAELEKRGYKDRVFLDYDELTDGKFDHRITSAIESAPIFIFVLSPGSLERCVDEDDWVRQEILHAFKNERHIIPVNFDGLFNGFGPIVPDEIKQILGQHQFSKIDSEQLLNVSIDKLIKERIAPIVKPNTAQTDTQAHNIGAEIAILADCDCEVYRFGKLLGKVKADSELTINLLKGNHLIEFVSIANPDIRDKQKLSIPDNEYSDFIEVKLKDKIEKGEKSLQLEIAKGKYKEGLNYYEDGSNQDYKIAFRLFLESAELGNVDAQDNLGDCYYYGRGVEKDFAEAVKWYRKAAEQGNANAQNSLGDCYYKGKGVETDSAETVKWYRKAAEQGHADAQYMLGDFYDMGLCGVNEDHAEAVIWYRKAAEQGHVNAQNKLGWMYYSGEGVEKDFAEAVKWYRKAAEQGLVWAQYHLGDIYKLGGEGINMDSAEAVKWYRKAAEQGDAYAQDMLGDIYYDGKGVKQDRAEAVLWFRKAAEQGLARAQYDLGYCYYHGRGIKQNFAEAVKWYRKAAEQGHADAQYQLGNFYQYDSVDHAEALRWYHKAAEQGYADAQYELASFYRYGMGGVTKNKAETLRWYRKAAEQGHEYGKREYETVLRYGIN